MTQFAVRGAIQPISFARKTVAANYAPVWLSLGSVDGTLYGFVFKGANKSTVWYSTKAFTAAGVEPPKTWNELLSAADTLRASGTNAYSLAGADGWTLTDLFENIYLRQAGPEKYDALTKHTIPWTDPSVVRALRTMTQILGDSDNIAGGTSGALQTDFPTSVTNVYQKHAKAAMVLEGDFVAGNIASDFPNLEAGTDYDQFPFPSIDGSGDVVVGGGDTMVMFRDTPAARALISYLATPEAAAVWAKRGGFSSPNKALDPAVYPDALTRSMATALANAAVFRFDMSDLEPSSFGATVGQGEFRQFQELLRRPGNVMSVARALERGAANAFGDD